MAPFRLLSKSYHFPKKVNFASTKWWAPNVAPWFPQLCSCNLQTCLHNRCSRVGAAPIFIPKSVFWPSKSVVRYANPFSELIYHCYLQVCLQRRHFSILLLSPRRGAHFKKPSTACRRERYFCDSKLKSGFVTFKNRYTVEQSIFRFNN